MYKVNIGHNKKTGGNRLNFGKFNENIWYLVTGVICQIKCDSFEKKIWSRYIDWIWLTTADSVSVTGVSVSVSFDDRPYS